ncbi:DNA-directed RNA polymerase I subunit RPA12 [Smittium culicis]|uniref:DNA-directed RNA polymerase subunit n=1 Tax=Smittium culicis TaxID=133412 RepID=A0A1R1XVT9_9FUNG|nr:DNA-directed RNA polymerase I subunit RPA12 [Smittium culicis]
MKESSGAINTQTLIYGSVVFCNVCGNLLENPADKDLVICLACGETKDGHNFENIETVTVTSSDAFPSILKNKRSLVQGEVSEESNMATIEELCAKCGNNQMTFYTMQLRSADEGQTVFYKCTKCSYQYRVNN